jgi:hypothetical protein
VCIDELTLEAGEIASVVPQGEVTLIKVNITERAAYQFYTSRDDNCSGGDTQMRLFLIDEDNELTQLDYNDDIDYPTNACSQFSLVLEPGAYIIAVNGFNGQEVNPFTLHALQLPTVESGEACIDEEGNLVSTCHDTDFCSEDSELCETRYAEGEDCFYTEECADTLYCFQDICSTYPSLDEACHPFEDLCPEDSYCFGDFGEEVCTAYPEAGETCSSENDQCQGDTY